MQTHLWSSTNSANITALLFRSTWPCFPFYFCGTNVDAVGCFCRCHSGICVGVCMCACVSHCLWRIWPNNWELKIWINKCSFMWRITVCVCLYACVYLIYNNVLGMRYEFVYFSLKSYLRSCVCVCKYACEWMFRKLVPQLLWRGDRLNQAYILNWVSLLLYTLYSQDKATQYEATGAAALTHCVRGNQPPSHKLWSASGA